MAILLENALVLAMEENRPVLDGQHLMIDQGVIVEMGKRSRRDLHAIEERIDCSGKIVMPGLVNAHSHLTEILQRSFRDNFRMEIWRGYRARTEEMAHLSPGEIGAAAELACGEMLKSGVTAVVDHFSTRPGLSIPKMLAILGAFERTGIRGVLAPSVRDQDFLQLVGSRAASVKAAARRAEEPWRDEIRAVVKNVRRSSAISDLMLGPSSPLNCSDALLREVAEMAEVYDLGVHTHLLETRIQRWAALKLHRKSLVEHLHKLGFLSPRLSAAHGVWLDEREMDLMASSGASVVHNPASNLKLGSGIAPVVELKKRGVNIALGTDGGDTSDSYSIFEQMRLAAFLSRVNTENPDRWVTALDALRMGTVNGAQAVPAWRGRIGRVKVGYRADLVILKPNLSLYPRNNVIRRLVFCPGGYGVDTVLVDGEIVVKGGRLTRVDEQNVIQKVEPISRKMHRFYGLIKKRTNHREELVIQRLYRRVFREDRGHRYV